MTASTHTFCNPAHEPKVDNVEKKMPHVPMQKCVRDELPPSALLHARRAQSVEILQALLQVGP
jgi:hypothetical protein